MSDSTVKESLTTNQSAEQLDALHDAVTYGRITTKQAILRYSEPLVNRIKALEDELLRLNGDRDVPFRLFNGKEFTVRVHGDDEVLTPLSILKIDHETSMARLQKQQAENTTLRNAQKACETCDGPTIEEVKKLRAEVAALRDELNRERAVIGRLMLAGINRQDVPPPKCSCGGKLVHKPTLHPYAECELCGAFSLVGMASTRAENGKNAPAQ